MGTDFLDALASLDLLVADSLTDSQIGNWQSYKSNSEYLVRNPVQAALQSNKILKANYFFLIFLAWHDPETQGVQELILDLFKVHSWLTYGWRSVRFWWYFDTFHENGDEVVLKIRLQTPTKTILEAVLFMYLLTNPKLLGFNFFMTQHVVVLLIMDMESAKSDVNGPKNKVRFCIC